MFILLLDSSKVFFKCSSQSYPFEMSDLFICQAKIPEAFQLAWGKSQSLQWAPRPSMILAPQPLFLLLLRSLHLLGPPRKPHLRASAFTSLRQARFPNHGCVAPSSLIQVSAPVSWSTVSIREARPVHIIYVSSPLPRTHSARTFSSCFGFALNRSPLPVGWSPNCWVYLGVLLWLSHFLTLQHISHASSKQPTCHAFRITCKKPQIRKQKG